MQKRCFHPTFLLSEGTSQGKVLPTRRAVFLSAHLSEIRGRLRKTRGRLRKTRGRLREIRGRLREIRGRLREIRGRQIFLRCAPNFSQVRS